VKVNTKKVLRSSNQVLKGFSVCKISVIANLQLQFRIQMKNK